LHHYFKKLRIDKDFFDPTQKGDEIEANQELRLREVYYNNTEKSLSTEVVSLAQVVFWRREKKKDEKNEQRI
jgi:hypothetical protein